MARLRAKEAIRIAFGKILKEKPYHQITVKDIADEAKVTRQIFYYYFKNMIELLEFYAEEEAKVLLEEKKKEKTLEEAYVLFFKIMKEKKDLINNLNNPEASGILRKTLEQMSKSLFTRILSKKFDGTRISDKDREFLINYFKLSFAAILYEWVEKGMEEDEKYLIKNLTLIINKGLDDLVDRFEDKTIKERQK